MIPTEEDDGSYLGQFPMDHLIVIEMTTTTNG